MDVQSSKIQQVTKASSDELLRKFADFDSDPVPKTASPFKLQIVGGAIRRKRPSRRGPTSSIASASIKEFNARKKAMMAERKSLLPTHTGRIQGIKHFHALGFLLENLEKIWWKKVKGASRILTERHCNSHVQLISDV